MVLNSLYFLLFFPIVALLYFALPVKQRWKLLLAASLYFYCTFDYRFLALTGISIFSSFYFSLKSNESADENKKKLYLRLTIGINLLLLCVFKYYNFFIESAAQLFENIGLSFSPALLNFGLPIGISFYTFQIIGYAFDVYYGETKAEKNLGIYSLYILFFPKLIAGPIERSTNLLKQLNQEHHFDYARVTSGIKLMAWGLFKKICIADRLAYFTDALFNNPAENTGLKAIVGCYFFLFQIYADFSGYSDMAVGASRVFGFDIVKNFNHPLISQNLTEFWKRWHISLYAWFNEYLYNPISFSLRSWNKWGIVFTIFVTLTLSGLWHGAALTFIIYGFFHALGLSMEYLYAPFREKTKNVIPAFIYKYASILITFHFFLFTLIIFKSDSIAEVIQIISSFTEVSKSQIGIYLYHEKETEFVLSFVMIALLLVMEYWQRKTDNYLSFHLKLPSMVRYIVYSIFIIILVYFAVFMTNDFVYAQF